MVFALSANWEQVGSKDSGRFLPCWGQGVLLKNFCIKTLSTKLHLVGQSRGAGEIHKGANTPGLAYVVITTVKVMDGSKL